MDASPILRNCLIAGAAMEGISRCRWSVVTSDLTKSCFMILPVMGV